MYLCEVSDGPHEVATRKGEEDTGADQPVEEAAVNSANVLLRMQARTYVWLGPLGVANQVAAIRPRTTAKIKSVGSADDMAVDGGS